MTKYKLLRDLECDMYCLKAGAIYEVSDSSGLPAPDYWFKELSESQELMKESFKKPSQWIGEEQEKLAQKLEQDFKIKLSKEEYERLVHRAILNFLDQHYNA